MPRLSSLNKTKLILKYLPTLKQEHLETVWMEAFDLWTEPFEAEREEEKKVRRREQRRKNRKYSLEQMLEVIDGKLPQQEPSTQPEQVTWRLEKVKCGKKGCKCGRGELHGPYFYKYFRQNGKMKSQYVKKADVPRRIARELRKQFKQRQQAYALEEILRA